MSNIVSHQVPFEDIPDLKLMTGGEGQLAVPDTFLPIGCPEKFKLARSPDDVNDSIVTVRQELRRWESSIALLIDEGSLSVLTRACSVMLDRVKQQLTDANFAKIETKLRDVLLPLRSTTGWRVTSEYELYDVEGIAAECLLNLAELVSRSVLDIFSAEELHQVTTYTRMAKDAVGHHIDMEHLVRSAGLVPQAP